MVIAVDVGTKLMTTGFCWSQPPFEVGVGVDVVTDLLHGGCEQVDALVVNKHVRADAECTSSPAFPTSGPNNLEASIGGSTPGFTLKLEFLVFFVFFVLFFFGHALCRSFSAKGGNPLPIF